MTPTILLGGVNLDRQALIKKPSIAALSLGGVATAASSQQAGGQAIAEPQIRRIDLERAYLGRGAYFGASDAN